MAHYLVSAVPKAGVLEKLEEQLSHGAFEPLRPFGPTLSASLRNARIRRDGVAVWEEEDYCRPPLAEERAAVLDNYFDALKVEPVAEGEGWTRIEAHPRLFPALAAL